VHGGTSRSTTAGFSLIRSGLGLEKPCPNAGFVNLHGAA